MEEIKQIIIEIEYLKEEITLLEEKIKSNEETSEKYQDIIENNTADILNNINYYENEKNKVSKNRRKLDLLNKKLKYCIFTMVSCIVVLGITNLVDLGIVLKPLLVASFGTIGVSSFLLTIKNKIESYRLIKENKKINLEDIEEALEKEKLELLKRKENIRPLHLKRQVLLNETENYCKNLRTRRKELIKLQRIKDEKYKEYLTTLEEELAYEVRPLDNQMLIEELKKVRIMKRKKDNM